MPFPRSTATRSTSERSVPENVWSSCPTPKACSPRPMTGPDPTTSSPTSPNPPTTMMRSPFVNAPRADSRSCGLSFAVGHDMRDAVASTGLDTVVGGGSLRQAFVAAMAPQGLTRRPSDPESMRSLAAEVSGLGARARRRAGLRPWLLAHPVDLVIAEVDPGAALAATAAQVPCVLHSFGRRPGPGALV